MVNYRATTVDQKLKFLPLEPVKKRRKPCFYGQNCYRKDGNRAHAAEESHPGDSDHWDPLTEEIDPAQGILKF